MTTRQRSYLRRTLTVRILSILFGSLIAQHFALGSLVVDLPDLTIASDGVNPTVGSLDVRLTLTTPDDATPPKLSSYNLNFGVSNSAVTFGAPSNPVSMSLFADANFFSLSSAQTIKVANDIGDTGSALTAFQNAGLVHVPFTVAAGHSGVYTIAFGNLNQIADSSANSLAITLISGSVTVTAGLNGDYNGNGVVDAGDYVVWRANQGTSNVLLNEPIGGTIGAAQYNQWRAHFGQTSGSGVGTIANSAVPEPAALGLILFAAVGCYLQRGRNTK